MSRVAGYMWDRDLRLRRAGGRVEMEPVDSSVICSVELLVAYIPEKVYGVQAARRCGAA